MYMYFLALQIHYLLFEILFIANGFISNLTAIIVNSG